MLIKFFDQILSSKLVSNSNLVKKTLNFFNRELLSSFLQQDVVDVEYF